MLKKSALSSNSKIGKEYTVASFDYTQKKKDEISFGKGDVMRIIKKKPSGWWFGYIASKPLGGQGWIPSTFVEEFKASGEAEVMKDFKAEDEEELTVHKGEMVTILGEGPDEDGNYLCEYNGKAGLVPSGKLQLDSDKKENNQDDLTAVEDDNEITEDDLKALEEDRKRIEEEERHRKEEEERRQK